MTVIRLLQTASPLPPSVNSTEASVVVMWMKAAFGQGSKSDRFRIFCLILKPNTCYAQLYKGTGAVIDAENFGSRTRYPTTKA